MPEAWAGEGGLGGLGQLAILESISREKPLKNIKFANLIMYTEIDTYFVYIQDIDIMLIIFNPRTIKYWWDIKAILKVCRLVHWQVGPGSVAAPLKQKLTYCVTQNW